MPQPDSMSAALHRTQLAAAFSERACGTLIGWASGNGSRSETLRSLRRELNDLADETGGQDGPLSARLLAAASGTGMAVACRDGDADSDTSHDERMVAEGVVCLEMYPDETRRVVPSLDEAARRRWHARIPERLRSAADRLDFDAGEAVVELASCTATVAALAGVGDE